MAMTLQQKPSLINESCLSHMSEEGTQRLEQCQSYVDGHEGVVCHLTIKKFVPPDQTVNKDYYI